MNYERVEEIQDGLTALCSLTKDIIFEEDHLDIYRMANDCANSIGFLYNKLVKIASEIEEISTIDHKMSKEEVLNKTIGRIHDILTEKPQKEEF